MGAGSSKSKTTTSTGTTGSKPTAPVSKPTNTPKPAEREAVRTRTDTEADKKFAIDALKIHNEYRAQHGAPPLVLSTELTTHAQNWAEELAEKDMLMHSKCRLDSGRTIGENIYRGNSVDGTAKIKAREPVDSWYNEIRFYDFRSRSTSLKASHFTQMVWKETTHMGIAQMTSSEGGVYVIANYNPAGNTSGKFVENVAPPPGFEEEEEKKFEEEKRKNELKDTKETNNGGANTYNDYECLDDIPEESDSCYEFDTVYAREVTNIII